MVERVTQNEVRLNPLPQNRLNAPDMGVGGEMIGRAVEGLGRQMGQAVEVMQQIEERYDTAAVKKADAEDAAAIAKIKAEALTATGFEAQSAVTSARERIEEIRRNRLSSLNNPRQQRMYADVFAQRQAQLEESFTTHAIKQVDAAERGASVARAETSQNLAVDSYDQPEAFAANIATMRSDIAAANRGAGADAIALAQSKAVSQAHVRVVQNILTDPDNADQAQDWIEQHAKDILPEHEPELRRVLRPMLEAQRDDQLFGQFMGFVNGAPGTTPPEDGEPDPLAPNPPVPRQEGEPIRSIETHVVGGKGRVTSTFTDSRGNRQHNALDVAAPAGTSIYPPMSGRVEKVWYDEKHGGGWSMLVQHPNGYITGYAHMRSRPPLSQGDEVDSTTVLGSVGSTGKSTGNHLHFTVRNAAGAKVDPQSIDWAAVAGSGGPRLVDPKTPRWKEGDLPKYSAAENQLGSLLDSAHAFATANNLSPREYERLISRVRNFAGVNEQIAKERKEVMWDKALDTLMSLDNGGGPGSGLTDPRKQIPNFGALDTPQQMNLLEMAQKNNSPEAIPANGETYLALMESSYDPAVRQQFLSTELRAVPDITPGERARLLARQAKMRNEGPGGVAQTSASSVWTGINRWYQPPGKDKGKTQELKNQLYEIVQDRVDAEAARLGRPLTDREIEPIVRSQIVTVTRNIPSAWGGSSEQELPRFVADKTPRKEGETRTVEVPVADRDRIIAAYQRMHGGAMPSEAQIVQRFLRGYGR